MKFTTTGLIIISISVMLAVAALGILLFLAITNVPMLMYLVDNHFKHYLIGLIGALIVAFFLWKRTTTEQKIIYIILPCMIASGWHDLIYLLSYLITKGTYSGLLEQKNAIYYLFSRPAMAALAGPILTGLLYLYDRNHKLKVWYWMILVMTVTSLLSIAHAIMDRYYGF